MSKKPLYLSATKLAIRLGSTAQLVNMLLAEQGYLEQDDDGKWLPTTHGRTFCKAKTGKDPKGKEYSMFVWSEAVLESLQTIAAPSRSEYDALVARVESLEERLR